MLEDLSHYYSLFPAESFDAEQSFPSDRILRDLLSRLAPDSKVLDFGCSSGRVLRGLTSRLQAFGVEINAEAANIASVRGIRIVPEAHISQWGPFDAILLADVYEHLINPLQTLAMLARNLRPGGTLAILTGNADAVPEQDWMGEFWYFRPEGHFQMASAKHMEWLANRLSLRLDQLYACSHYDIPMKVRLRQRVQAFAYETFRRAPGGFAAAVLRRLPVLNRAERWPLSPALTYTKDHFVAVMKKP